MIPAPFRIALAQVNATVGDLKDNYELMREYTDRARILGADLVAFPEMCLTGYPPEDLLLRPHFIQDSKAMLKKLARCASGITVVAGCVYSHGKKIYNAAAVLHRKRVAGIYCKHLLPNYGVFDENRYFIPGKENLIWKLGEAVLGISVCEDVWYEDGPHDAQTRSGAGIILNIGASPYYARKQRYRQRMLQQRAYSSGSYVCFVNAVGGQDELIFDGASVVIGPTGKLIAAGRQFEQDLVLADLDLRAVRPSGKRPGAVAEVTVRQLRPYRRKADKTEIPPHMAPGFGRWEEVYRALMLGLRDYTSKNGFEKVVIGLSGGIDSTVAAAIATDALGPGNVIGVTMPSEYTSQATLADAQIAAGRFGIRLLKIPIAGVLKSYLRHLASIFDGLPSDVTEENLQARIRGNLLMALSNKFGWLVVTTGNKSETSVGYCTLFGDMAGGFSLLKDVPKTWVYELAKYRNQRAGGQYIPQSVIDRPPTAELKPDQKDEDILPPYEILDPILDAYIENDRSRAQIVRMGFDAALVKRVAEMVDRNEYKRRQAPPGLKITAKAFGRDRRMPITNKYA